MLVYKGGDLARARGVVRLSYYNDTRKIANPSPDIRCYIFDQLFGCNTSSQPRKHETKRTSSQLLGIRYSHWLYCSVLHCKIFMDLITNTFFIKRFVFGKKERKSGFKCHAKVYKSNLVWLLLVFSVLLFCTMDTVPNFPCHCT